MHWDTFTNHQDFKLRFDIAITTIKEAQNRKIAGGGALEEVTARYSNILSPQLCGNMCFKLPTELREMVYGNIADMGEDFVVGECQNRFTKEGQIFYRCLSSSNRHWLFLPSQPWYLKPVFVGDGFAQEISAAWYCRSHFTVLRAGDVGGFSRNRGFGAVTPKIVVRKIDITIDCRTR
jgi:hypothetical protein